MSTKKQQKPKSTDKVDTVEESASSNDAVVVNKEDEDAKFSIYAMNVYFKKMYDDYLKQMITDFSEYYFNYCKDKNVKFDLFTNNRVPLSKELIAKYELGQINKKIMIPIEINITKVNHEIITNMVRLFPDLKISVNVSFDKEDKQFYIHCAGISTKE